ncbi:MAG TPA: hypothetical protein VFE98_03805 [Candidatus Bathyarchaeia archaeon]|nr:hypothetical protein [Candidatus Bathyarchaeia archaeon]
MPGINSIRQKLIEARRIILVIVGWGTILSSLAMTGILQGVIVPNDPQAGVKLATPGTLLYFVGVLVICLMAGLLVKNIGISLVAFLAAYALGVLLSAVALSLPGVFGYIPSGTAQHLALVYVFTAFFPITLFLGFVGSIIGAAVRDI